MIRNKLKRKSIATFLLVVFLNSIFLPSVSLALTSENVQQEYLSYETLASTDMVNLITGDFVYNMPVVNVPSPEGGFSLPLSYHSGIRLDQEASWVGLGWGLNAGAIVRQVNHYPDDFSGERQDINIYAPGGSGFVKNSFVFQHYYDSEEGHGGRVQFTPYSSFGLGTQKGIEAIGISYSGANGWNVDSEVLAISLVSIAADIVSFGGYSSGFMKGLSAVTQFYSVGLAAQSIAESNGVSNLNEVTLKQRNFILWYDYKYFLDVSTQQNMYGVLNLHEMSSKVETGNILGPYIYRDNIVTGATAHGTGFTIDHYSNNSFTKPASDMNMLVDESLATVSNPTHLGYDNYNIMGSGISGNVSPYREEVGSVAYPSRGDSHYRRYKLARFQNYKVGFRYLGELANSYQNHLGRTGGGNPLLPISRGIYGFDKYLLNTVNNTDEGINWIIKDPVINAKVGSNTHTFEAQREGYRHNQSINGQSIHQLMSSKDIQWYTNEELATNAPYNRGFVGYFTQNEYGNLPANGIGGFAVTSSDGTTHHYALPVYNKSEMYYVEDPSNIGNIGPANSKTINANPYATTWLLTAITGPDYIDRGITTGLPNRKLDENDWGYWVKFDYGKFADNYSWRIPYYGINPVSADAGDPSTTFAEGVKETYYLDAIETRTHKAIFVKSLRKDARSSYEDLTQTINISESIASIPLVQVLNSINIDVNAAIPEIPPYTLAKGKPSSSLKLDEVIVLTKGDYNHMVSNMGFSKSGGDIDHTVDNGDTFEKVIDQSDISDDINSYLQTHLLKKTKFHYSYDLCLGTPNSFNSAVSPPQNKKITSDKLGKLTLNEVSFLGRNNVQLTPSYLLDYEVNTNYNPNYSINRWDGWRMYTVNGGDHSTDNIEAAPWSLRKITTPSGSLINVSLSRDEYNNVSGDQLNSTYKGGNYKVNRIALVDENGQEFITKYEYFDGTCSVEPEFSRHHPEQDYYQYYNYPRTPILYNKVNVLSGFNVDGTFNSKAEYTFNMPHKSMVNLSEETIYNDRISFDDQSLLYNDFLSMKFYKIGITTAIIGKVNSIVQLNNRNDEVSRISFEYQGNESTYDSYGTVGLYTDGTILSERIFDSQTGNLHYKLNRTTVKEIPALLSSITVDDGKHGQRIDYLEYDHLTGSLTKTKIVDYLGRTFYSEQTPAYKISEFSEMGSKTEDISNKNMLSQIASTKLYQLVNGDEKIVENTIQTWNKNWDYRVLDAGQFKTVKYDDTYYTANRPYKGVWRPYEQYVWKGDLDEDGRFRNSYVQFAYQDFWTFYDPLHNQLAPGWDKVGEISLYDHYSHVIEAKDINGNYSSVKMGYNGKLPTVVSNNSKYTELYYSGAEDQKGTSDYFSTEVLGADKIFTGIAHTGKSSVKVIGGQDGFKVSGTVGNNHTNDFSEKLYRTAVWVHSTNRESAQLGYELKSSGNIVHSENMAANDANSIRAGDWYLVTLDIPINEHTSSNPDELTVYTRNISNESGSLTYFDDFRIHPINAAMTSYVYDEGNGQLLSVLDNENFGVKYSYDNKGQLKRVFKEIAKKDQDNGGFKQVNEFEYNFSRTN